MTVFEHHSSIAASAQQLYDYHLSPGAFSRLSPPWEPVRLEGSDQGISEGLVRELKIGPWPLQVTWRALHQDFEPAQQFVDTAIGGPFRRWFHRHRFEAQDGEHAVLRDRIEYELPLGLPLGSLFQSRLRRMFCYRHRQTQRDLQVLTGYPGPLTGGRSLKLGVTGASGFVGTALTALLRLGGHQVVSLVRGYESEPGRVVWWPEPDRQGLEGLDAVVHLAGETVGQLWTKSAKEAIYFSRVEGTRRLCRALTQLEKPPQTLISFSAIGYYDQTLDRPVDESGPLGKNFLSEVCRDWEGATAAAQEAGIRVCHPRVGLVLGGSGGLLAPQLPAFKMGLGPIMGRGVQKQSFVDLDDLTGAVYHLLHRTDLAGPFNVTAPNPVSQAVFARTLAQHLGRPQWLRVPEKPGRLLLREQAEMIFDGVEALPRRLQESGYRFLAPTLTHAFSHHLG